MDYFFLGSGELLTAFRFAGVDGVAVENGEEALAAFRKITGAGEARILVVEEGAAATLKDDLANWQLTGRFPLVVEIPGLTGHLEGRRTLAETIREAIGIRM